LEKKSQQIAKLDKFKLETEIPIFNSKTTKILVIEKQHWIRVFIKYIILHFFIFYENLKDV